MLDKLLQFLPRIAILNVAKCNLLARTAINDAKSAKLRRSPIVYASKLKTCNKHKNIIMPQTTVVYVEKYILKALNPNNLCLKISFFNLQIAIVYVTIIYDHKNICL